MRSGPETDRISRAASSEASSETLPRPVHAVRRIRRLALAMLGLLVLALAAPRADQGEPRARPALVVTSQSAQTSSQPGAGTAPVAVTRAGQPARSSAQTAGSATGQAAGAPAPLPDPATVAPQQPTFRGGITFVRVDVIVTDRKAEPVTDLKAEDFEVLEDGKPQAIDQFRLVRVDGNPRPGEAPARVVRSRSDEETEAARDDVRVFAIVLDDYHVRRANSISIRATLLRFIQNQLRPNDLVAVMSPLTPVGDLAFTRDHTAIANAVQRFEGVKFDYRPRNQYEENISRYPTETVERIRNDITMGALNSLAIRMGSLREGRKSIIFVSEGFTAMLPPQMRRADASQPENPIQSQMAAAGQDSSREETAAWFGQTDVFSRMRDLTDMANRNNSAIYSLDPRGLAPFEFGIDEGAGTLSFATDRRALQMTQDTLRSLSEETDGRAIVNRNTLDQGLAQIVKDSSVYYLMGYNTTAPTDGKFHQISVRVKRRHVQVRARKGFWAATAEDMVRVANPTPDVVKPVQVALASIATSVQAGKYVRTWVGTERGTNGKTKITLLWEPLPQAVGVRRDPPGRLRVIAADAKGDLVFRGRVPEGAVPAGASTGTGSASTGAVSAATASAGTAAATAFPTHRLVFEAPPGKTELRLTVEAADGGGTLDSEIRTIDVPDLTTPQPAITTPRVFRARTARDLQAIVSDANATPTAAREFSRTERILLRFDAYATGSEVPVVTAALLNRAGTKMSDVTVAPAGAGGTHQIDLGLNAIAAGEYLVEIALKGTGGAVSVLVPFRVGS